jgi:hypothetical protein
MESTQSVSQGNPTKDFANGEQKNLLRPSNGAGLLKLAGIVKNAPVDASINPASR